MSSRESRAVRGSARRRRRSKENDPPSMSDLRIVLLGKSVSENSRVGNSLLGRAAFDSEAPPDVVERVGGRLKDRHVTIINSPQLLQTHLSLSQITQTVRECVNLSDPGPHAFILALQYKDFTEEDMRRVKHVLEEFSEEAIKRTIVITTDGETPVKDNELIQHLTAECGGGHLQLDNEIEEWLSEISQQLEKILKENSEEFLTCEIYDCAEETLVDEYQSRYFASLRTEEDSDGGVSDTRQQKLNLMLCGSDETLKNSVSKLIRGKKKNRLISVVELPALNRLSEEEVMRQTLRCVSLCDPGVHVFLLVFPDAPLTDEHKAEMEEIQKMFSSGINKHIMVLIIQKKNMINMISKWISSKSSLYNTSASLQTFGGHSFVLESSSQVPALLQDVEKIVKQNKGSFYTTLMYLHDRVELERNKHAAEIEELRRSLMKNQLGVTRNDNDGGNDVRIVLLGKTGVGKSVTGNTILRKTAFKSIPTPCSVTRECQKETTEFNRRQITVIDTPGLFDTGVDNVETRKEIVMCISMAAPGPHVFLLVIPLGRFTQEEKDTVKMIQDTFGEKSRMYTMVLFTGGDQLRGRRIEDFIEDDDSLKNLIQQCGKRYHVFNNIETEDRKQVSELLDKIDCMVAVNGGSFYTNEMFQLVEKNIKEEQERIMKEKDEEIKRIEEELKTKYYSDIEQMKKDNERERQEMQNELRKSEEEFKKRGEEIKKETDENVQKEMKRKLEEKQREFEEENKRKEKSLGEQQQTFIKYMEEKHEKEKQNLQERIQRETREQAEHEYNEKLGKEVAKALKEAEEKYKKAKAEAEEKYKAEKDKALEEAEETFKTEKDKALKEAEETFKKTKAEAEEKYKAEKDKALEEAEETFKKTKAEAEEKYKAEKAKALKEAEAKYKREKARALKEAEAKLPYSAKRARDWSYYAPVLGGAAGGAVGGVEDVMYRIFSSPSQQPQNQFAASHKCSSGRLQQQHQ